MELQTLSSEIELTDENKQFIQERAEKYKTYSQKHLNKKIKNAYCVLEALLVAKSP